MAAWPMLTMLRLDAHGSLSGISIMESPREGINAGNHATGVPSVTATMLLSKCPMA